MRNAKLALGMVLAASLAAGALPMLASAQAVQGAAASPAASTAAKSPAPAASGSSSRPGLSSNQPVDITADEAEVQNEQRLTIWRGNVEALQGQNRLRTPQLTVYFAQRQAPPAGQPAASPTGSLGSIERMEATGPVYFVTPTQTAKGDKGVYTASDETITLTGNVVLVQDRNVAKGDTLTINQRTGQSTLVSAAKGRGASQRVRGVFYPSSNQAQAGSTTAPTPGAAPGAAR